MMFAVKSKGLILVILVFGLGYFFRFFVERQKIKYLQVEELINSPKVESVSDNDQFITYVDFNGDSFTKSLVTIRPGDYLAVTNKSSETQMWLESTVSALVTGRGYGEGERLQTTLSEVGRYVVREKVSKAFLGVVVEAKN